jgi:hypothetical protein
MGVADFQIGDRLRSRGAGVETGAHPNPRRLHLNFNCGNLRGAPVRREPRRGAAQPRFFRGVTFFMPPAAAGLAPPLLIGRSGSGIRLMIICWPMVKRPLMVE